MVLGRDLQEIGFVKGCEQVQVRGTRDVSGLEQVIGTHVQVPYIFLMTISYYPVWTYLPKKNPYT